MKEKFFNKVRVGLINAGLKFISVDDKLVYMFLETNKKNVRPIVINSITKPIANKFIALLKKSNGYNQYGLVHNGYIQGIPVSFIRTEMGAPNAAITIETLKRTDAKIVIRADVCGSLTEEIPIGSVFLPYQAIIGEGTSPYYCRKFGQDCDESQMDNRLTPILQEKIASMKDEWKDRLFEGKIWTTDALLCETEAEVQGWQQKGAQAVDMETSVLYLLSGLMHLPSVALLGVTDIPGSEYDLFTSNNMHPESESAMDRVVEITQKILPVLAKTIEKF